MSFKKEKAMKEEKKPPLVERICRALDIPPEAVSHTPYIELHGKTLLKIRDGGKILLYTREKIKISLPHTKDILTVIGSELSCSFFNLGSVGIEGNIETLTFAKEDISKEKPQK